MNRTHGIGNIVSDRNASRLVAHEMPSLSYTIFERSALIYEFGQCQGNSLLCTVKSGVAAPEMYLIRPFAARADAPVEGP